MVQRITGWFRQGYEFSDKFRRVLVWPWEEQCPDLPSGENSWHRITGYQHGSVWLFLKSWKLGTHVHLSLQGAWYWACFHQRHTEALIWVVCPSLTRFLQPICPSKLAKLSGLHSPCGSWAFILPGGKMKASVTQGKGSAHYRSDNCRDLFYSVVIMTSSIVPSS